MNQPNIAENASLLLTQSGILRLLIFLFRSSCSASSSGARLQQQHTSQDHLMVNENQNNVIVIVQEKDWLQDFNKYLEYTLR